MNVKRIKTQLSEELRREARIRIRIKVVTTCVGAIFLAVVCRAFELHCFRDSSLGWVASKQYNAVIPQSSRRGRILDRNGKELAVSLPVPSIYADPKMVLLTPAEKNTISKVLNIRPKELNEKLKSPRRFVWLKRMVSRETLEMLKGMQGIFSIEESKRIYPNGEMASQLLGAVGLESEALAGIELTSDRFLSSKRQDAVYRRDARGKFYFSPVAYQEQDDIADVYLTLDKQIQFVAESALKTAAEKAGARGGSTIVMDVETGEVLAMANMPAFDPNNYSKYPQDVWRNRAITDTIEPGSTFKVLVVASALEDGVVTPDDKFDCENGAITVGNAVLHDHRPYDVMSVRDIIKHSSNIGAWKVAQKTGKVRMFGRLKKFGIGRKTGIDFPGEVNGIIRSPDTWQPVEFATMAFGQGLSVTPIQMATAFAAIANGGRLMKPYIINKVVNNQGITVAKGQTEIVGEPISAATSDTVIKLLEGVVQEGGTGTMAASKEYSFAGKTGTAQKVIEGAGHYVAGKYYASFVGIAPSDKPRVVVFVGLDEPKGQYYGGMVSAPVFREVAEATLKHLDVPSSLSRVVTISKGASQNIMQKVNISRGLFQKVGENNFLVPDLHGATIRDVMTSIGEAEIKVKIEGSGVAISQSPSPGSVMSGGDTFFVSFKQSE